MKEFHEKGVLRTDHRIVGIGVIFYVSTLILYFDITKNIRGIIQKLASHHGVN